MVTWFRLYVYVSYLDVDEVSAVLDGVDVGVVDGLLVVFDAGGPVWGRAKDLGEREDTAVIIIYYYYYVTILLTLCLLML